MKKNNINKNKKMTIAFEKYSYMTKSRPPESRAQYCVQPKRNLISSSLDSMLNAKTCQKSIKAK